MQNPGQFSVQNNSPGFPTLDSAQYLHQLCACDLEHRPVAERRKDILLEDPIDLRQRALPSRFEAQRLEVPPATKNGFEGVLLGEEHGNALLAAMRARIDALGDEGAGIITPLARNLASLYKSTRSPCHSTG